jgi:hypothetical protein
MHGFYIVAVAFFGGVVMVDDGGQGREGCEGLGDRERAARRRREACFVREPAGVGVAPTGFGAGSAPSIPVPFNLAGLIFY